LADADRDLAEAIDREQHDDRAEQRQRAERV